MSGKYPGGLVTLSNPIVANSNAGSLSGMAASNIANFNPAYGAAAPGIWTLDEAEYYQQNRLWPIFDPYFNNTTLMLHGNGTNGAQNNTFLDSSSNASTITRNGNTTQGTFTPFSQTGWAGNFNTSTTYLTVTDTANLRFGSANFTIEAWIYRAASGAVQTIASKGASTPTGWVFQISAADKLVFTDTSTSITGATSLVANTWYYVAVVRTGTGSNQTILYVNGISDATGTSATNFNQTNNMLVGADRSTANFANGYISNLRLSNTNRTISSVPTSALTADANTIFLALNSNWFQYTDSTAAYTAMTITGSPSVQAFSPFAPTAAYSATTVGGSGYFSAVGDYLTVPYSTTNFDWYTSGTDYTVEAWFYITSAGWQYTGIPCMLGNNSPTTSTSYWSLGINASLQPTFYYYNGAQVSVPLTSITCVNNVWYHIAMCKTSSGIQVFCNGVGGTVTAISGTPQSSAATTLTIGQLNSIGCPGYITNVRIVKGTALYSGSTYTIPTTPPTAVTNTKLLLNCTNAGIIDNTGKNDLVTVGNAQISTTQSKYGGSSMYFDGTGDYMTIPNSPIVNLSGDFTIEAWLYRITTGVNTVVCCVGSYGTGANGLDFYVTTTNFLAVYGNNAVITIGTTTFPQNTWTHVALVRNGTGSNNVKMYINGIQESGASAPATNTTSFVGVAANGISVGADYSGSAFTATGACYIDDLRISRYARYLANFTPPTSQLQDQ